MPDVGLTQPGEDPDLFEMDAADDASGQQRFVWPPRPVEVESPEDSPTATERPRASLNAVEQFEKVWLGVRERAFGRQAALTGWSPDERGSYCWRCGTGVGAYETDGDGCAWCRRKRLAWDRCLRLGAYEGILRDGLLALKLEQWRRTGADIGRLMGEAIRDELERQGIDPGRAEIVPVPMSFRSRMKTGVDHTLVLARAASGVCRAPVRAVLRSVHGPGQAGLAASERAKNIRGRIRPRRGARLSAGTVTVVLDDIRTTGATMREACKAVRRVREEMEPAEDRERIEGPGGELIWAVIAGVTPPPERRRGSGA